MTSSMARLPTFATNSTDSQRRKVPAPAKCTHNRANAICKNRSGKDSVARRRDDGPPPRDLTMKDVADYERAEELLRKPYAGY